MARDSGYSLDLSGIKAVNSSRVKCDGGKKCAIEIFVEGSITGVEGGKCQVVTV